MLDLGSLHSIKIGDLGRIVTGKTPSTKQTDFWGGNIPFVTPADLQNGKRILKTERTVTENGANMVRGALLPPKSICVSCIGNLGYTAMTTCESVSNQQINSIIPSEDYDADFVYYLMKSLWSVFKSLEGQSTTLSILNKTLFSQIEVTVPELTTQKRIARILSSLDDKIEVNNQINRNLEEQAKAIFKSWFVDFEPFQNGEFIDSELGKIPKGWQIGHFSDVITSTVCGDWGKDSPTGNYTEKVYCIRGADIPEVNAGNKGKMPLRYILPKNLKTKRLSAGDIVVEISGGSPTQSTGRSALISDALLSRYKREMICTNFCRAITPKKGYSFWASVLWKSFYSSSVFFQYENGTTGIKNLDLGGFIENEPIIIPPQEIAMTFEELGNGFVSTIFGNGLESEHLSMIRDTLLPKLMSGEVYLKETTYGK